MYSRFEQSRVNQLISAYTPSEPPRTPLDFGDLLSLLWRLDLSKERPNRERYYRRCALALAKGMKLDAHPVYRHIENSDAGDVSRMLPNVIYRLKKGALDAHDGKAALDQLVRLRSDILRVGTYQESWVSNWPGSGLQDGELRERVFAVLFTALQGQFTNFGRLLLVTDIVIANLLLGLELPEEIGLIRLVSEFGYPDPSDPQTRETFLSDAS